MRSSPSAARRAGDCCLFGSVGAEWARARRYTTRFSYRKLVVTRSRTIKVSRGMALGSGHFSCADCAKIGSRPDGTLHAPYIDKSLIRPDPLVED